MSDQYLERILASSEISAELKDEVQKSYSFLRREFGDSFFTNHARNHPVAAKLLNLAPWQIEDLIQFSKTLEILKNSDSNYDSLLGKLRGRDGARAEGIPLVEISQLFLPKGLELKIEPQHEFQKKPDLEIRDQETGELIYGEITVLNESEDRAKEADDYKFLMIHIELVPPAIPFACRQLKLIEASEKESIAEFISKVKKKVIESDSFEVFETEYFVLAFASESRREVLFKWCNSKNIEFGHLQGLSLDYNETKRIVNNKIKEKVNQIPPTHNGLIFIKVRPLYFYSEVGVTESLDAISRSIAAYPNIIGVVVYSFLGFEHEDGLVDFDRSFLRIKQVDRHTCRYLLFIDNPGRKLFVSPSMLNKIVAALTL